MQLRKTSLYDLIDDERLYRRNNRFNSSTSASWPEDYTRKFTRNREYGRFRHRSILYKFNELQNWTDGRS